MDSNTRTHKNEDPISIFLPSVNHLVVLLLCSLGVYGEERPRAVTKVGLSLQWLILCRPRVVAVAIAAICYSHFGIQQKQVKFTGNSKAYLGGFLLRCLGG